MSGGRVLVVEDDVAVGKVLVGLLTQGGIGADHVASGELALDAFDQEGYDVVVTDLQMPGMDGMTLLRTLRGRYADVPVIMITAHGNIDVAVEAMKAGAAEFMSKPFDREEVLFCVRKALTGSDQHAKSPPSSGSANRMLLGNAPAMMECVELVARAAGVNANVLIRGETGTGKEVAARAIHHDGARKNGPFVAVNCAALPDQLLESELFGYEKGAFTGACARKPGRVALAEGGTLFLDEIGDTSLAVQAKLLRLLQEKKYEPLGGTTTKKADVRFIAATHRDLEAMVEEGTFRQDLYYRLDVIPIVMPPLRQRQEDVPLLAHHFADRLANENGRDGIKLSDEAKRLLSSHSWPGNVRELLNFVERLVVFSDGRVIDQNDVDRELGRMRKTRSPSAAPPPSKRGGLEAARSHAEKQAVVEALDRAAGNETQAARLLGVSRRQLYNLLEQHELK